MATIGIAASLLAYAISPSVRHAVGHAAHSVKGAVGHVLDRDAKHAAKRTPTTRSVPGRGGVRTPTSTAHSRSPLTSTAPERKLP